MDRLKTASRPRSRVPTLDVERRIKSFIRAFGVADEATLRETARRLARLSPDGDPRALDAAAGAWFARLFGWPEADSAKALAVGKVAWLCAGAGVRWPAALLSDTVPHGLMEALKRAMPAYPPANLGDEMPPARLEPLRLRHLVARPVRLGARPA